MDETNMRPAKSTGEPAHPTVGMYDRPNRPVVSPLMIGLIVLLLIAGFAISYFLFLR